MNYKHIDGVKVKAKIYYELGKKKFRYRMVVDYLKRPKGKKTACVIMMNPSKADKEVADKSVQFMEKVVFEKDFPQFKKVRRLIIVNQFAFYQTNNFKGLASEVGSKNDEAIQKAFEESDIIIIGWGKANKFKDRQRFVCELLEKLKNKKLYETNSHPSRAGYKRFIKNLNLGKLRLTPG